MTEEGKPFNPVIVSPDGKPARLPANANCSACGAKPSARVASGGFGVPHPVCGVCGHEFHGEVFDFTAKG